MHGPIFLGQTVQKVPRTDLFLGQTVKKFPRTYLFSGQTVFISGKIPEISLEGFGSSRYSASVKTTIDIPDKELEDAIRFTGAATKRDAVVTAISDFNRRHRVEELVKTFGTWDMLSNDEIEAADMADLKRTSEES